MRRVRSFAVPFVFAAVVLLGIPASLFAGTVCESALPRNIDAGPLGPIAVALLQQSPTFRQQCQRIAAAIILRVQVRIVPARRDSRGETTIRRYEAGALRAEVLLAFGEDYIELLAHELEHVLEQVERISLVKQLSTRQAWITDTGAFETARALEVGVRARQECELLAAETVEANRRAAPRQRHPIE
jgi:hypothetical protein